MKKINLKISSKKIIFYTYTLLFLFIVISLCATSLFLYDNFFQSLSQSDEVINLSRKIAFETIDVTKFDQLITKLEKKASTSTSSNLNNPFD